jgi:Flp pilus assembly protein TadG
MFELIKNFKIDEKGTTAVEFALVAAAFIALVIGVFECGRLFMTWNAFQYSLEDSTRTALVNDNMTTEELEDVIEANLNSLMLNPDNVDINVAFTDFSGINVAVVNGVYTFRPIILVFIPDSWATFNISAQARLPMPWS